MIGNLPPIYDKQGAKRRVELKRYWRKVLNVQSGDKVSLSEVIHQADTPTMIALIIGACKINAEPNEKEVEL